MNDRNKVVRLNNRLTKQLVWWRGFLLLPLAAALACFTLLPTPNAFGISPAPDGGYPNGNTAEGNAALFSLTSGANNTADGASSLVSNTTGNSNTATGASALFSNTTGNNNTANGLDALAFNTSGSNNTANGASALQSNTVGVDNAANGAGTLFRNTSGNYNTASGDYALFSNTTGNFNVATGDFALINNTTGANNTATGTSALFSNTADDNTATGFEALKANTTGVDNTAVGFQALQLNVLAFTNVAVGTFAAQNNDSSGTGTAVFNTAVGGFALRANVDGTRNTAVGAGALDANGGSDNTAVGDVAGGNLTTGSNNIDIGSGVGGVAGESGVIRIGTQGTQTSTFIAGIEGVVVSGDSLKITSAGQLGIVASSARFKKDIQSMDKSSEAILALRPVTFHYKKEIDPKGAPQFGLVAEEVEKVNPALVSRDAKGQVYTVHYDAVNAMLLNEFLKEHRKVQELEVTVAQQNKGMEVLAAQLKKQAAQIQNVSNQLELSKAPARVVDNN